LVIGIGRCSLIDILFTPRAFDTARPGISIFHAKRRSEGRSKRIAKKRRRIVSAPQELQMSRKLYGGLDMPRMIWRSRTRPPGACKIYK
jgi:hypothetical protein